MCVQGKYLAPKCRDLVLVAAPKDARSYFADAGSSSAVISKVCDRVCMRAVVHVHMCVGGAGGRSHQQMLGRHLQ